MSLNYVFHRYVMKSINSYLYKINFVLTINQLINRRLCLKITITSLLF